MFLKQVKKGVYEYFLSMSAEQLSDQPFDWEDAEEITGKGVVMGIICSPLIITFGPILFVFGFITDAIADLLNKHLKN